jgi:hypothetical protein
MAIPVRRPYYSGRPGIARVSYELNAAFSHIYCVATAA